MATVEIPVDDLLESLKAGYTDVKECLKNGEELENIGHAKGFCRTIEQILSIYGGVTEEEMLAIKEPILGGISVKRKDNEDKKKSVIDLNVDFDTPTILRRK